MRRDEAVLIFLGDIVIKLIEIKLSDPRQISLLISNEFQRF